MLTLSAEEARLLALRAQGFVEPFDGASPAVVRRMGAGRRRQLVHGMLRRLGAVQLDTISVLARSHELVAYSRFGAIDREAVEDAYWHRDGSFEYWSHAACILPIESWPLFAFRRRHYRQRGCHWHDAPSAKALREVRRRLEADGPQTVSDLGGARRSTDWWDWSETKNALEWLLIVGDVVCASRTGWRRVYDLPERVVDAALLGEDLSDDQCQAALVEDSARSLGVGTLGDIADVHRLKVTDVRRHLAGVELVEVSVAGWQEPAWAHPEALTAPGTRIRHRTTLLSPFDSLVWHRPRAERLFGMSHRLEAYTPAHKRIHGYFAMPVLHQGRLVARVDPARERTGRGRTAATVLVAKRVTFEPGRRGAVSRTAISGTAAALAEAATWVGADGVRVDEVVPATATAALRDALVAGG